MNELKPEDVRMALAWYEVVGKNIGSVTVPYDEIQAISNILREKDAEIERLKEHQESVATVCNRANEHYNTLYEQAKEILKAEARAEAITEFAERLIKNCDAPYWCVWMTEIDEIAKEMKGETYEN